MSNKEIVFTNIFEFDFFPPKPAVKEVPEWYKNTPEYAHDKGKKLIGLSTPHTIKKCMPVFDAITAGYIIYTQVDVYVEQRNGEPFYSWPSQNFIDFHPVIQAPLHPLKNDLMYPKFMNTYSVKTPKGYSTLFIPPMHNPSKIFTVFEGLVDTDIYTATVNFPFVLNDVKWEGIIEAGTPIVQAIPIKRDSWKHKIGSDKERMEQGMASSKLKTLFFNSYKKQFWSRKEYK